MTENNNTTRMHSAVECTWGPWEGSSLAMVKWITLDEDGTWSVWSVSTVWETGKPMPDILSIPMGSIAWGLLEDGLIKDEAMTWIQ